ncbi:formyltetrahydrofolate deformylase [Sphaeroforma arctica JP610]|uniref:Formyltetrahydrofolate deformylase n=1 Tax=Sphaeroforma arctica JP610 TaxID=667725 RepID=A0A0L0FZ27_9EUKA|nr:formyltetrahydrofolate deformylase [Sphaeroforma arctica JP610]KNC82060.1 formyltetrahydrofolate deformylase [Sphaeroforma arctica JP610]|eukprot:XP_014155962.1 formyltetrahydrofolate deformylase [Sphaeroforma arctica JP610]
MVTKSKEVPTATLLISCPDQHGLVARVVNFIDANGGGIVHAAQHTDVDSSLFLQRVQFELDSFKLKREEIAPAFDKIAEEMNGSYTLHFSDRPKMAIWVSKQDHCLLDLLWRHRSGELPGEVVAIVSNHTTLQPIAQQYGITFHHIPITKDTKIQQELKALELMAEAGVELIVLAKYMQILSAENMARFPPTINIHHSFLPAFAGAKPYHRAHERGVKIIGATGHYVTADLDEGPIIEQDVTRISHKDSVSDLVRKGKDMERLVLSRAVRFHLENRVLRYGNRTVVID